LRITKTPDRELGSHKAATAAAPDDEEWKPLQKIFVGFLSVHLKNP